MQCTFCGEESRARCASNHVRGSFSCGARHRACAPESTHAPRTRSQHGRMRTPRDASRFSRVFVSPVSLRRARVAAHFYRRALFLLRFLSLRDLDSDESKQCRVTCVPVYCSTPISIAELETSFVSFSFRFFLSFFSRVREPRSTPVGPFLSQRVIVSQRFPERDSRAQCRGDVTVGGRGKASNEKTRTTTRQTQGRDSKEQENGTRSETKQNTHATTDEKPSIR